MKLKNTLSSLALLKTAQSFTLTSTNINPNFEIGLPNSLSVDFTLDENVSDYELTWARNGQPITTFKDNVGVNYHDSPYLDSGSQVSVSNSTSVFNFSDISLEDAGQFSVSLRQLVDGKFKFVSTDIHVNVFKQPSVSLKLEGEVFDTRSANFSESLIASCSVSGAYPEPSSITFLLGNKAIESLDFTAVQDESNSFYSLNDVPFNYLVDGSSDNAGVTCRASNDLWSVDSAEEVEISVLYFPTEVQIQAHSNDQEVQIALIDEDILVNCNAHSNPESILEIEEVNVSRKRRSAHNDHYEEAPASEESVLGEIYNEKYAYDDDYENLVADDQAEDVSEVEDSSEEEVVVDEEPALDAVLEPVLDAAEGELIDIDVPVLDSNSTLVVDETAEDEIIVEATSAPKLRYTNFIAEKSGSKSFRCLATSEDSIYSDFSLASKVLTIMTVHISKPNIIAPTGVLNTGDSIKFSCSSDDVQLEEGNSVVYGLEKKNGDEFVPVSEMEFSATKESAGSYRCGAIPLNDNRLEAIYSDEAVIEIASDCAVDGPITYAKKNKGENVISTLTCPISGDNCEAGWVFSKSTYGTSFKQQGNTLKFTNLPTLVPGKQISCYAVNHATSQLSPLTSLKPGLIAAPVQDSNTLMYVVIAFIVFVVIFVAYKKKQAKAAHKKKLAQEESEALN